MIPCFTSFSSTSLLLRSFQWMVLFARAVSGMPMARQHHQASVPTASWILVLALFLALQVNKKKIFLLVSLFVLFPVLFF